MVGVVRVVGVGVEVGVERVRNADMIPAVEAGVGVGVGVEAEEVVVVVEVEVIVVIIGNEKHEVAV